MGRGRCEWPRVFGASAESFAHGDIAVTRTRRGQPCCNPPAADGQRAARQKPAVSHEPGVRGDAAGMVARLRRGGRWEMPARISAVTRTQRGRAGLHSARHKGAGCGTAEYAASPGSSERGMSPRSVSRGTECLRSGGVKSNVLGAGAARQLIPTPTELVSTGARDSVPLGSRGARVAQGGTARL